MNILAFDTSGAVCAAAVLRGGVLAARRAAPMERGHAQALVPMLAEAMAESGLGFDALDAVGVTVGPGAFTGIRIGLATARGIGLAAALPVYGVTGFAAIAAAVPDSLLAQATLLVAIESRREEIFVQLFGPARRVLSEPRSIRVEDLAAWLPPGECVLAGDAAPRAAAGLAKQPAASVDTARSPDPAIVARLAGARWESGERPPPPAPFYLRAPDVTLAADAR